MSTKYLSSFIDGFTGGHFRNGTPDIFTPPSSMKDVQAEELKQILLDAKEGIEVKNTTHEFYETLERITNELRGMTEHSTAFLSRVRKSDAPDYFNIIKNPMDLGTVLKKVKAQQYKDKSSFKADLDLIWDNCLLYNTLPNHPLRRSAMTLRSRANHLLEFVTDPVASTPAPQVIHSQSASRFDRPGSRLDALDATHVIISTANLLGEPKGAPANAKRYRSPSLVNHREESTPLKHEEKEGSSFYDEDFQDVEEDEEDESIRTRKGLTSHKSQPGGGRNLELLKGLAAQDPSANASPQPDDSLSIYPSGLDAGGSSSRSPADASGPAGTPSIPEVPGTYPGQGSALVARRATGTSYPQRDRRIKTRTPSIPPPPAAVPLAHRTALRRTPDLMARFAKLVDGREEVDHIALLDDFPGQTEENNVPFTSNLSPISSSRSSSSHLQQPDDSVDWWQMVCSDDLLANGLPDVPAVPCRRRKPTRRKLAGQNAENGARPNPCWEDIANLRKIKSTHHKLSVLRRDAPPIGLNGTINDYDSEADEIVHADQDVGKAMTVDFKQRALKRVEVSNGDSITALSGRTTLQTFCSTILEHVGFDVVQRSALDNIANLLTQYLMSLGSAAAFHRDHHTGNSSLGSILKSALHDVAADDTFPAGRDPLAALARYRDVDMPEQSRELASLNTRLSKAYEVEIEEAQHMEPRFKLDIDVQDVKSLAGDDADSSDPAEIGSSYALLRMLLEAENDHLGLEELHVPNDTGFPLHLLYASWLRQAFPSSSSDLPKPFDPPPPFVSLVPLSESESRPEAIDSTIGILRPFLRARSLSTYDLYDDESLPLSTQGEVQKALATRPDVPYTTGKVVIGKRKREVAPATAPTTVTTAGGLNLSTGSALSGAPQNRPIQPMEKAKKIKAV